MLFIECSNDWVVTEVDFNSERAVAIVNYPVCHIVGREVIVRTLPLGIPPAVGDTNLIPVTVRCERHIEGSGLNLLPNILWERGNTLVVAVVTVKSEATVDIAPVDYAFCTVILPEHSLLGSATATDPHFLLEVEPCSKE